MIFYGLILYGNLCYIYLIYCIIEIFIHNIYSFEFLIRSEKRYKNAFFIKNLLMILPLLMIFKLII